MIQETRPLAHPDYGLDAPALVRGFLHGGAALIALGLALRAWAPYRIATIIGSILLLPGAIFFIESILMIGSSRDGKLRERDRLLDGL